jgi:hypothetical protein
MARRVVTADRYALGESISSPPETARWKRRKASWTRSSASLTLPTIR